MSDASTPLDRSSFSIDGQDDSGAMANHEQNSEYLDDLMPGQ